MRWMCMVSAALVVALSTFAFSQDVRAAEKKTTAGSGLYSPIPVLPFVRATDPTPSQLGAADIRPIQLNGAGAGQVPEPSSMAVVGLLGTLFLIRRRRLVLG
jgi:hypothetical protein